MAFGRSIEAKTQMGLETPTLRAIWDTSDQGACSKKDPAEAGDGRSYKDEYIWVATRIFSFGFCACRRNDEISVTCERPWACLWLHEASFQLNSLDLAQPRCVSPQINS